MAQLARPVDCLDAWASACAAYRLNDNQYLKAGFIPADKKSNQELVREVLANGTATVEDQEQGQTVRDYISKVVTMAMLKGTLDTWGQEMARVSQLDVIADSYDLERERVHERLSGTSAEYNAQLGDKIELDVEVLENKYSQKWATYYVTVVDTNNRAWYFAHRKSLTRGQQYTIRGTVKRIADRMVQLNRVRLLDKEAV